MISSYCDSKFVNHSSRVNGFQWNTDLLYVHTGQLLLNKFWLVFRVIFYNEDFKSYKFNNETDLTVVIFLKKLIIS